MLEMKVKDLERRVAYLEDELAQFAKHSAMWHRQSMRKHAILRSALSALAFGAVLAITTWALAMWVPSWLAGVIALFVAGYANHDALFAPFEAAEKEAGDQLPHLREPWEL